MVSLKSFFKYFMPLQKKSITGRYGFMEYFLAIQRAKMAKKFIPDDGCCKKVLDIGCGAYPIFLLTSKYIEKYGIDKTSNIRNAVLRRVNIVNYEIEKGVSMPFEDGYLDAVTMLAVMEHIEHQSIPDLMREIRRVLKPGGICVITLPSPWSERVLRFMARVKLVSASEMSDHKEPMGNKELLSYIRGAGFENIKFGYFEFFMNRWFVLRR